MLHGKALSVSEQTYKQALNENTSLGFNSGTFDRVFKIKDSMEAPRSTVPKGVTMI